MRMFKCKHYGYLAANYILRSARSKLVHTAPNYHPMLWSKLVRLTHAMVVEQQVPMTTVLEGASMCRIFVLALAGAQFA